MLVLSRKKNESIVIGEGKNQVRITVIEARGDKVRLGIEADPSVAVFLQEVYAQILKEKEKDGTKDLP